MKKLILILVCLTGITVGDVYSELSELEAEQRVLRLKIENYKLQKELAEYEAYLAKQRANELAKRERAAALLQLREELRNRRSSTAIRLYPTSG